MSRLAEIREADADPALAKLYADIRRSSGLPQVNLIYRHLATLPGALPAAWEAIGPWIRSADADAAVARLLTPEAPAAVAPLAVSTADTAAVLDLLDVYARGNALNLLALSGLRRRLHDPGLPTASAPPGRTAVPPVRTIPPLPRLAALPPGVAEMVAELAGLHEASRHGVTPSLYLHLAHWPGILPLVHGHVVPYARRGDLSADRASTIDAAAAYGIAGAPSAVGRMSAAARDRASFAIDLFASSVIPDLIAVGRMLAGAVRSGTATGAPPIGRAAP